MTDQEKDIEVNKILIQKLLTTIGQLENSITTMEILLEEREFQDYCDNLYSCISYHRQAIYKIKHN